MGNQANKKVNPFGNPSGFFQILIREILANRQELKYVESSWIREIKFEMKESGKMSLIIIGIEIPVGTRTPFNFEDADIHTEVTHGRTKKHKIFIRIRL